MLESVKAFTEGFSHRTSIVTNDLFYQRLQCLTELLGSTGTVERDLKELYLVLPTSCSARRIFLSAPPRLSAIMD